MKKSESKTGRHGRLLGLALAAVLVGTPTLGWAQTIDVSGSNGADGSKADLAAAISDINAVDNSANDVIIDLTGTHNDPGATTGQPRWYIEGSGAGLQSVTLNGQAAGGDRAVLDGQQNTGAGVLLGLENAESATLKNLIIKNGYSTTPYPGVSGSNQRGGGLYVGLGSAASGTLELNNVLLDTNTVSLTAGAALGGGLAVNYLNGGNSTGTADFTSLDLQGNQAIMDGSGNLSGFDSAIGGGGRLLGVATVNYNGGTISNNSAQTINGSHAHGGGLAVEGDAVTGTYTSLNFQSNTAEVQGKGVDPGQAVARGGGFFGLSQTGANSEANFIQGSFTGNQAKATGADTSAMGGAAAILGNTDASFDGTSITSNSAVADTGDAYGGALAFTEYLDLSDTPPVEAQPGSAEIKNANISGNRAQAGNNAYGGAIFSRNDDLKVINGQLTGNSAGGTNAFGGAIFMDTADVVSDGGGTNARGAQALLTLEATTAKDVLLIQGNTANGQASGIHFGTTGGDSAVDGVLDITGAGTVKLLDPVTVALNNGKDFTLTKNNTGKFQWGGANQFDTNGGSTYINLTRGTAYLTDDFSAGVGNAVSNTDFNVNLSGSTLAIDASRNANKAMFDYSNAASGVFTANDATSVRVMTIAEGGRQILDVVNKTVVVADLNNSAANITENLGSNGSLIHDTAQNYIVTKINYDNPEQDRVMRGGANTRSASGSLQTLVSRDTGLISDAEFAVIRKNYRSVTSEYGMAQGRVAVDSTAGVFNQARQNGQGYNWTAKRGDQLPSAGDYDNQRARLWAGYVGNFQNVYNNHGYFGYEASLNGALIGLNYDLSEYFTVGLFGGITSGNTEINTIKSEVDSDGVHIGVMAAITPPALPALGISFDLGYSQYDNDGWRKLGGYKTKASFDQDVITAGLGLEYIFNFNEGLLLTPYLDLRYTHLKQDDYRERGLTATKVNGYNMDSFTSELGAKLSRSFEFDCSTLTPHLSAGWRHEYGDRDVKTKSAYINPNGGLVGNSFNLSGASIDRDAANIGVGAEWMFDMVNNQQFGFTVDYNLLISENQNNHSVFGGLNYRF